MGKHDRKKKGFELPSDGQITMPLDEQGRRRIIKDLLNGDLKLLSDEELLMGCALPLAMGVLNGVPQEKIDEIGAVLGAKSSLLDHKINGHPVYSAVLMINVKDWEYIVDVYNKAIMSMQEVIDDFAKYMLEHGNKEVNGANNQTPDSRKG